MTPRAQFCARLHTLAGQGDEITDADFADACYRAVSEYGFDARSLSNALDIGPMSYERWMTGANLPHSMIRGKILLTMAHILNDH